jgi:predicted murein hydrolase (TIGR00659 family)
MSKILLSNPAFGLILTFVCYWIGLKIHRKLGWSFLQPIVIGTAIIIAVLMNTGISYMEYVQQNLILNYMLPITAVVLAVPLYKNYHIMKKHAFPILAGIVSGTVVTISIVVLLGKLLGADKVILASMIPKSATNPIALEVSGLIGGIPSLTIALVVITGIFGAAFGPELLNLFRVKNEVARGIAIGSMTHAVGTSRAFKESEVEGAMSSLAMAIAGTLTAILSPLYAFLFL